MSVALYMGHHVYATITNEGFPRARWFSGRDRLSPVFPGIGQYGIIEVGHETKSEIHLTIWQGEVEVNLPMRLHTHIRSRALGRVSIGGVAFIQRRNADRVRAADTTFIRQARVPRLAARQHIMAVTPDLVVEILSNDTSGSMTDAGVHGCAPLSHTGLMSRFQEVIEANFAHFAAQFNPLRDGVTEVKPNVDARVAVFFRRLGEARE